MNGDVIRFPSRVATLPSATARVTAEAILSMPVVQLRERAAELQLEDPEQLLSICELLRGRLESGPALVRDEADFLYRFLEEPCRPIGSFDERDYYLGELALIAGIACRVLARRDEARHWFDLAESSFVLAHNSSSHFARVAYQRLALRTEERDFTVVMKFAPRWKECFVRLGLPEDALKCGFLEAHALKESERYDEAIVAFRHLGETARSLRNETLAAIASQNLFQIYAFLGQIEEAAGYAEDAAVLFRRLDNKVGAARLQLGFGYLLRTRGRLAESIEAFREAQRQFAELELHADIAATQLVLGDLLLDAGQPAQAEWEIRAALPVIDELKLVPEGIAALSLLRDSLRRRQIDRHALRSLNGYFEELGS